MRPVKLTMIAFGPYRNAETIDFSLLEGRRLFVISGNTGAGKTTIFDAVCFALYGAASGGDRAEPRMLRSQFADEETHTAVDFTFAAGKRMFRVFRQMGHRKGTNKSETGGKAELYEITGGQEIPCVDRFIVSDVNDRLEAIIGLTQEQFSQIVMLPQGEFQKLLTSDTENKEEILRRIFRTGLYQKLEERFQQKSRDVKDARKEAQSKLELYLKQAQETLPLRADSLLFHTFQQEFCNAAQVLDGLARETAHYQQLAEAATGRKAELAGRLTEKEAELRAAVLLNNRFTEFAAMRAQHAEMERHAQVAAGQEQRLFLAEKAIRIVPYEEQLTAAARVAEAKRQQLAAKRRELAAAEQSLIELEALYKREEARDEERKTAERELARLAELVPIVRGIADKKRDVERLCKEEQDCSDMLGKVEAQLATLRGTRQTRAEELRNVEAETAALPKKLEALERMRDQARVLKEAIGYDRQLADYARQETELEQALRQIRLAHDRKEAEWIAGQASLLAAHLHDGEPCPVCGSAEHPHKAKAADALPSRESMQQTKDELRTIEGELSAVKAQAAAARSGWDSKSRELDEFGIAADRLAEQYSQIELAGKKLRTETDRLKQVAADDLPRLRQEVRLMEEHLDKLQQEKEQCANRLQTIRVAHSTQQLLLLGELERIPHELQTPDRLQQRLHEQQQQAEQLAAAWLKAQQMLQQAQTRLAAEQASEAQMTKQLAEADASLQQAEERFRQELGKAGFASGEEYRAAQLAESEMLALRTEIAAFRQNYAALARQIELLEQELAGKKPVDTDALAETIAWLKSESEQAAADFQAAVRCKEDAVRLQTAIAAAHEQVKALESRLEQVLDIYQMLKGDNPLKISFERYILLEFLEQILHAANARLHKLSNGQFLLRRSDRLEIRGKQSGLGLDVYDAYTGQNRDVKTLSGGEKFNASLCLALGMTDVIQAHQGGVSIEMMFIDEGFGSLDEDSLNKAIATLIDLQRAGRIIGVISHVPELRQAFPAVLEVRKTKEGCSRTTILLK